MAKLSRLFLFSAIFQLLATLAFANKLPLALSIKLVEGASDGTPSFSITVTNNGSKPVLIALMSPRYQITLYVYDSQGRLQQPVPLQPEFCSAGCTDALSLQPGQTFVPRLSRNGQLTDVLSLSDLGYPKLHPGQYSVEARPGILLGGSEIISDTRASDSTVNNIRSNAITVTIP